MAKRDVQFGTEVNRKLFHVSSALIPLAYVFVPERETMLWLLAPCLLIAVVIETLRQAHPGFRALFRRFVGHMVRDAEWNRVSGATYVLLGALLSIALFPRPVAIAVLLILAISDSAASLVGLRYGRSRFLGKSLAGSFAFFVTALPILWLALPDSRGIAFSAALIATLAEACPTLRLGPFELNDNLLIPLLTGGAIWLMQTHLTPH